MKARVYIDTRGASRGQWRNAPNGVRVALHTSSGAIIELEANEDGNWYVHEGDSTRGGYTTVASGRHSGSIQARLEYLRGEIEAERISYGEIAELESLAEHISGGDTLLLQWANVPEAEGNAR